MEIWIKGPYNFYYLLNCPFTGSKNYHSSKNYHLSFMEVGEVVLLRLRPLSFKWNNLRKTRNIVSACCYYHCYEISVLSLIISLTKHSFIFLKLAKSTAVTLTWLEEKYCNSRNVTILHIWKSPQNRLSLLFPALIFSSNKGYGTDPLPTYTGLDFLYSTFFLPWLF